MLSMKNILNTAVVLSLCGWATGVTFAETVSVTKDCSLGPPCSVTSTSTPDGFFRLTSSTFNWEASYSLGTTLGHFWVSDTGANMATTRLSTAAGQLGGTATLPLGIHYISIRFAGMSAGTYSVFGPGVHGDPHITTTNGIHYDFQGAGEFVMLKHPEKYEVQTRMTPVATTGPIPANPHTGLSTCVSINTAAAVRVGKQRVTYEPNASGKPDPAGLQLRIDGELVSGRVDGKQLKDGGKIWKDATSGELRIQHPDFTGVRIIPHWWAAQNLWYLDLDMTSPPETVGIAGHIPDRGWLPALADGSPMGVKPADLHDRYNALYVKFADSWRVTDSNTLFDYAPGKSTKTYTMTDWPGEEGKCSLPSTDPVHGVETNVAEQACKAINSPRFKQFCMFDVMVTGNIGFGQNYAGYEKPTKTKPVESKPSDNDPGLVQWLLLLIVILLILWILLATKMGKKL